jgi:site-specific DNA recombinase
MDTQGAISFQTSSHTTVRLKWAERRGHLLFLELSDAERSSRSRGLGRQSGRIGREGRERYWRTLGLGAIQRVPDRTTYVDRHHFNTKFWRPAIVIPDADVVKMARCRRS